MTGTHARRTLAASLATMLITAGALTAAPAPAAAEPPAAPDGGRSRALSAGQASARAADTGKRVEATQAATGTDTLIANPDGTMTLKRSAVPTRALVDGEWQDLDPTLIRNADGTWSPKVATTRLVLSGGGDGPMATLSSGGLSAGIAAPWPLLEPDVDGDTATYTEVLPSVDLRVTAEATGGFSEVIVVHDPDAAVNPELKTLALPTLLSGITLTTDETGNITGRDRTGGTVLTAPAPIMWDSTTATAKKHRSTAARSTFRGPGADARTAAVKARVGKDSIELTPHQDMLTSKKTKYPVFIDPTFHWSETGGKHSGWATVARNFPNTNRWKSTPDPNGRMQVGNPDNEILSRTFINFPLATSVLSGAFINAATMKITQTWSYSCTPSRVNLYAPAATLTSSNARWSDWADQNLGSVVDFKNAAHGYNASCPAAGVPFDVKTAVAAAVAANKSTQTFALVAGNENDTQGSWKEFLQTSPTIEITYNHKPATPTALSTSPATSCSAEPPTVVGLGDVLLYARVSDRNGGKIGAGFQLWNKSDPTDLFLTTNADNYDFLSGDTAYIKAGYGLLTDHDDDGPTTFQWRVQTYDGNQRSAWSPTCSFRFDPTRAGPPIITEPAPGTTTIGTSTTITVAKAPDGPTPAPTPTSYLYQINGNPHGKVDADADGKATITVTPTRSTNVVSVSGLTASGNIGNAAAITFNSNPAAQAANNDLNGDDLTDLITPGGRHGLASGLWLAASEKPADLAPAAVNLGARGNGRGTGQPADFDGAQITTGRYTGTGMQDLLVYYPSGTAKGVAVVLRGTGDGSPIQTQIEDNRESINRGTLWDDSASDPLQLVNAGHTRGKAYPDLLAVMGTEDGYYLNYYPNGGAPGGYGESVQQKQQATPTGGIDWNTWTLASTPQTDGKATVFLWQKGSGQLYVWRDFTLNLDTFTLSYTQQQLATSWNAGQDITLHAADIDNNGTADLWSVAATATATPYLVGATTITPATSQRVLTASHAWLLKDAD